METALIAGEPVFAGVDEGDMVRIEEDAIELRCISQDVSAVDCLTRRAWTVGWQGEKVQE